MTPSSPISAAVWSLDRSTAQHPKKDSLILEDGAREAEFVFDPDLRPLADSNDIKDGGECRSIVKIQSRFYDPNTKEDVWMMGNGWLLRGDTIVTAGHVIYDCSRNYGAATQSLCNIGYGERASINDLKADVRTRQGLKVMTTLDWMSGTRSRSRDVAFIQVTEPFTGVPHHPLRTATPVQDSNVYLGVDGYPGDRILENKATADEEQGVRMYELYRKDLGKRKPNMIDYKISTYRGQSGAPSIRDDDVMKVAGTQCHDGGGRIASSAIAMGGKYGNDYEAYLRVFHGSPKVIEKRNKISIFELGSVTGSELELSNSSPRPFPDRVYDEDTEGFFDILKGVISIGLAVRPIASSLVGGPIGGIVCTAASSVLSANATAERTFDSAPNSAKKGPKIIAQGLTERTVLNEAALQTVLRMEPTPEVLSHMEANWNENAQNLDAFAGYFAPILIESGLDMAVKKLAALEKTVGASHNEGTVDGERRPLKLPSTGVGPISGAGEAFLQGLYASTKVVPGEEVFFDGLGLFLGKAVSCEAPIVSSLSKDAIASIAPKIIDHFAPSGGKEATIAMPSSANTEAAKLLFQRAAMGEVALQALMSLPMEMLNKFEVPSDEDGTENLFDSIKSNVQRIAPLATSAAAAAAQKVGPILLDALRRS